MDQLHSIYVFDLLGQPDNIKLELSSLNNKLNSLCLRETKCVYFCNAM